MARRQISSSFSVCQLGFLGGVFGCYCMAGMTKTYVSRSWYLICSRTKTLMTFVRVWASANACFPYSLFLSYLLVMFSSWSVFFFARLWWQEHTFLDAETWLFKDQSLMSSVRVWASAPLFTVWVVWSLFVVHGVSTLNSGSILFYWFTYGDNLSIKWCYWMLVSSVF